MAFLEIRKKRKSKNEELAKKTPPHGVAQAFLQMLPVAILVLYFRLGLVSSGVGYRSSLGLVTLLRLSIRPTDAYDAFLQMLPAAILDLYFRLGLVSSGVVYRSSLGLVTMFILSLQPTDSYA